MNGHINDSFDDDAASERQAIIAKYDAGRDKKNEILSWEDPALEVYHVTDRYGFIHNHRLPDGLTAFEKKIRAVENERLNKWLKMLKRWDDFKNSIKLRRRVYKGVPNALRGEVWARILGVPQIKLEQEGKYEEMRQQARSFSEDVRQIDLDVNRTFRNNIMFRERYGVKQQALFHVLTAYSVYNSEVGYCQGMSQIAALLLMFMNEEEAFWSLSVLMTDSKHAMHGFFIPGFPKLKRFQDHHDRILTKLLPKLKMHLDKFDIHSSLYTLKWFFQCFLDRVPFTLTLRLWDIYMLEGEIVLTTMSYTLLKLHEKTIQKMDMEQLLEFLQIKLEQNFGYHDDAAVESLQASMEELVKHRLLYPGQAPAHELPQRPFGLLSKPASLGSLDSPTGKVHRVDVTVSNHIERNQNNEQHQANGNIISTPSLAGGSPISTSGALNFETPSEVQCDFPLRRTISLYDNVDLDESMQAAYRHSTVSEKNRPQILKKEFGFNEHSFPPKSQVPNSIPSANTPLDSYAKELQEAALKVKHSGGLITVPAHA